MDLAENQYPERKERGKKFRKGDSTINNGKQF
jgi:hypothetical protein